MCVVVLCYPQSLNEGRSVNPGDTQGVLVVVVYPQIAQRRPERQPRRHLTFSVRPYPPLCALNEGRSVNPGDTSCFTFYRDLLTALNEGRSVNPGDTCVLTRRDCGLRHNTLNEGRSVNPGDTLSASLHLSRATALNEGRSVNPGSTKAGASTPATQLNSAKGQYRDKPSLVHGRGSLDDDAFAAISRDFGRYPARMVRIQQSRLP